MTGDDRMGVGIVAIAAVFAVGMAVKGHVAWGGSWVGVGVAVGLLVAAVVFLVAATTLTSTKARTRTVHIDAGDWKDAARHEAGHLAAMKKYGGRNLEARIYPDGSGYATCDLPREVAAAHDLAIDYAGGYAEGSFHAAGADLKQAAGVLARVGMFRRGKVERDGRTLARKAVSWGATDKYARKLERTGRW